MSDQVIAEIERSVDGFTAALGEQVMAIYAGNGLWLISAHMHGIRVQDENVMAALSNFEALLRVRANYDAALARTLGLEAAE